MRLDTTRAWFHLAGALLAYLLSLAIAGINWHLLLVRLGVSQRLLVTQAVFLSSQPLKYLPGNAAHYLVRVSMGHGQGLKISSAGTSIGLEILFSIAAGLAVIAGGWLVAPSAIGMVAPYLPSTEATAALLIAAVSAPVLLAGAARIAPQRVPQWARPFLMRMRQMGSTAVIVFLLVQAGGFVALGIATEEAARAIQPALELPISIAIVAFAAAWIVSTVSIGVPAGIGVREAALMAGLSAFVEPALAVSVPIALRLVTLCGDGVAFVAGLVLSGAARRRGGGSVLLHRSRP
jgi:hypothetical protein